VSVRSSASDFRVRLEVHDNGPGVPPAERGGLFTEFARLSNRPTGGEESTGIGLSIVKQLIESEQGAELPVAPGS
jgi:signal transduction histidine kinase